MGCRPDTTAHALLARNRVWVPDSADAERRDSQLMPGKPQSFFNTTLKIQCQAPHPDVQDDGRGPLAEAVRPAPTILWVVKKADEAHTPPPFGLRWLISPIPKGKKIHIQEGRRRKSVLCTVGRNPSISRKAYGLALEGG